MLFRSDGAGFDPQRRGLGAGFLNMSDRLGAIGGSLHVESAPALGTRVAGELPLPEGSPGAAVASGDPTLVAQPLR